MSCEHEKLCISNMLDLVFCCLKLDIYYSLLIFGGHTEVCVVLYREEFRKQFKKENPENKAVSAVSVDHGCCVTVITLHEIGGVISQLHDVL